MTHSQQLFIICGRSENRRLWVFGKEIKQRSQLPTGTHSQGRARSTSRLAPREARCWRLGSRERLQQFTHSPSIFSSSFATPRRLYPYYLAARRRAARSTFRGVNFAWIPLVFGHSCCRDALFLQQRLCLKLPIRALLCHSCRGAREHPSSCIPSWCLPRGLGHSDAVGASA